MENPMILKYFDRMTTLPLWVHAGAAAVTFVGFTWVKGHLDASYASSGHPVDYATGQTTFSGEAIKGYYSHMLERGTLDIYRMTQYIDFGFILAMICMALFVCTLGARASGDGSWGRRIGLLASLFILTGALSDSIENAWSFVMLANPTEFANWLAWPYSFFASIKFALITLGMATLFISVLLATAGRLTKKPKIG